MPDSTDSPRLLILCRDLLFASKITATAQAQGVAFKVIRDPAKLIGESGRRLILDVSQDGAIDAAVAWKGATGGETIGFISHVDAEGIAKARSAGIDQVLTRGQFTTQISSLIVGS